MTGVNNKTRRRITGTAVPKPEDNQNTDAMVYGGKLNKLSFTEYGNEFFKAERDKDPNHPLDDPRFKGANILIGGDNYGSGSSREHAIWALRGSGVRAVIANSFARIFYRNAINNGFLAIGTI